MNISLNEADRHYVDSIAILHQWQTMDNAEKAVLILSGSNFPEKVEYAKKVVNIIQGKEQLFYDPIKMLYYTEKSE